MTFDEWADEISARVAAAVPGVRIKRKFDDMRRWTHAGKECQVHAVSDTAAALVLLRTQPAEAYRPYFCRIALADRSYEAIAARIIGWFQK